jgi:DNA invertase Pin-like site-specific DNA recombinase
MSTETQLKGDSLRRQMELSKNYALENNLELVTSIDGRRLADIGISAFHGKNATDGVLALFLAHLNAGNIEDNSVLLIESLDRLSREKILSAITQFISIVDKGVEVITLVDGCSYTKEAINKNPALMYVSMATMIRANEESETKSVRGKAVWGTKRLNAKSKIVTRRLPGWLHYDEGTQKIKIDKNRGRIVKKIFDLYSKSMGMEKIAQKLNEEGVPTFGDGIMWHRSYIKKLLQNRSVIGEYQPFTIIQGKRVAVGDPIIEYYPSVVTNEIFNAANGNIEIRKAASKGRKGAFFTNLFSGLVRCSQCGSKLYVINKGPDIKGGKYLWCSLSKGKAGCKSVPIRLQKFEDTVLKHLHEIDYTELFGEENAELNALHLVKCEIEEELRKLKYAEENVLNMITDGSLTVEARAEISARYNDVISKRGAKNEELRGINAKIGEMVYSRNQVISEKIKDILGEIKLNANSYELRGALQTMITKVVDHIEVSTKKIEFNPWEYTDACREVIKFREIHASYKRKKLADLVELKSFENFVSDYERKIKIRYKNGECRTILMGDDVSLVNRKLFSKGR